MPTTMFDPRMDVGGVEVFKGKFNDVRIDQVGVVPGTVSNFCIDSTQPFNINLEWQLEGNLTFVNMVLGNITGQWRIEVYAEKMGPGNDLLIYTGFWGSTATVGSVPAVYSPPPIVIPANTLPQHLPESGMYRLCVVVFANTSVPGGQDIIGCYEGPMILSEEPA
jgi:hypothetical protein